MGPYEDRESAVNFTVRFKWKTKSVSIFLFQPKLKEKKTKKMDYTKEVAIATWRMIPYTPSAQIYGNFSLTVLHIRVRLG